MSGSFISIQKEFNKKCVCIKHNCREGIVHKNILRLYFLTDQLNVVYEIYAIMDLVFIMNLLLLFRSFMPWVNEALTWEAILSMWIVKKKKHLKSVWVAEHAQRLIH